MMTSLLHENDVATLFAYDNDINVSSIMRHISAGMKYSAAPL